MIKMIVSDLDGTILHTDFSYTRRTICALKQAISKGIQVVPASGRTFQDIQAIFQKEDMDVSAICLNGAQVCDTHGIVLYENEIDKEVVKDVLATFTSCQLSAQLFSENDVYAYQDGLRVACDMQEVISRNMKRPISIPPIHCLQTDDLKFHKILKIETMNLDTNRLEECRKQLMNISAIDVTSSVEGNLEITHLYSTKGYMLERMIEDYHIAKDEVLIFGDSMNDVSLFERFPHCIAVANAKACIKMLASAHCGACEEDGVAAYIEELLCK